MPEIEILEHTFETLEEMMARAQLSRAERTLHLNQLALIALLAQQQKLPRAQELANNMFDKLVVPPNNNKSKFDDNNNKTEFYDNNNNTIFHPAPQDGPLTDYYNNIAVRPAG
ncbi:MAG: hypothetical protein CMF39_00815 [Legionellaceae bacterium]|nr:hypothetical protein [Legionellaceae bacterium]